ncbi:G-type lectin S-receptor-like serine/threonine-protein kinase At1g11330-like isoform X1 [Anopheles sinensis]|uniref:G-type lectin S-receptor-like serine/threonine-protein kinase At1g11330-like isoform X1 n=1 Tax=Anopheles sinensis TaxID=74873 RepID=A0A084VTJ3_ANOSI|nr:G-type lectin S-receptor-like serine/threonine-protein kinase At1g11330-like isoform X1 [Anopheles sinensis]
MTSVSVCVLRVSFPRRRPRLSLLTLKEARHWKLIRHDCPKRASDYRGPCHMRTLEDIRCRNDYGWKGKTRLRLGSRFGSMSRSTRLRGFAQLPGVRTVEDGNMNHLTTRLSRALFACVFKVQNEPIEISAGLGKEKRTRKRAQHRMHMPSREEPSTRSTPDVNMAFALIRRSVPRHRPSNGANRNNRPSVMVRFGD